MSIDPCYVGIDISKHHLDIFDPEEGRPKRIANDAAAATSLAAGLTGRDVIVVFEATGRYGHQLQQALLLAGVSHARVHPSRARDFARATGHLAKTDTIDARVLALMGATLRLPPDEIPDPDREKARLQLATLLRRRDQLVAMRQQETLRLGEATPMERESLERHIAFLDAEIAEIEVRRKTLMREDARLKHLNSLLVSIPGVGPVTSTALLALMPEMGNCSPKALAALAGLAPFNVDSGQHRGTRTIKGGRKRVRTALYMAAVSAWRSNSQLRAFVVGLMERGKPFKLAIIALARKILTIANALLREAKPFHA